MGVGLCLWPRWSFRRVVLNPVPPSVQAIRADAAHGVAMNKYVFRFRIDPADMPAILASRPFKEVASVEYRDGILHYGCDPIGGTSFWLYDTYDGKHAPSWFQFGKGDKFRAYVVEKQELDDYFVDLLLYREDIGEAYFIEYDLGGSTAFHIRVLWDLFRVFTGFG